MDIIDRTLQPLDPSNTKAAFLEIQNYLGRVMETIDFTLSKHQDQLQTVDPESVKKLTEAVATLTQAVSNLSQAVNGFKGRLDNAEQTIKDHTALLENHEFRIEALENKP